MTSPAPVPSRPAAPRIVVLDDYENALQTLADWRGIAARAQVDHHHAPLRGEALVAALSTADALVLMRDRTPLTAALIDRLPRLRYVVFTGTRNNALDFAALAARGIPVSHTAWGPSKDATAELTWALILAASKRLEAQLATMRAGGWRDGGPLPGVLRGAQLGLIGLGEIGSRVAGIGRAFGMEVACWSPNMTAERARQGGARFLALDELLATSQVVSLHLVASASTRHLLNAERLARLRSDALLVNTSRASLVDTQALLAALARGRPAHAALDVFDEEPLPAHHPLRALPNVTLTPHLGFVAQPVFEQFARGVVECLEAWLDGRPLVRPIAAA
jgi:phosphoglycerate dehydrogenase-like enzyme